MKLITDIIFFVAFIVALSIGTFIYGFSMVISMELIKWLENRKSRKNQLESYSKEEVVCLERNRRWKKKN